MQLQPAVLRIESLECQSIFSTEGPLGVFRGPKTHPKSRNTKNTAFTELVQRVRANFCLLPCDMSQEPNGNCSEKLVQMNLLMLGGFWGVDFPPLSVWGTVDHLQGSLGPSGGETPKKSEKSLPGPEAAESLEKVSKNYFWDLFQTFSRLFPYSWGLPPRRFFSDFFGVSGSPCRWSTGSHES